MPGQAVGGRRALVEAEQRPARGLLEALLEDAALAPEGEHASVHGRQVGLRGYVAEAWSGVGHGWSNLGAWSGG